MVRANLGQLLGNLGETAPPAVIKAELHTALLETAAEPPKISAKPKRGRTVVTAAIKKQNAEPAVEDPPTPAYLRFVRKETRLREDQQNQLTLQARRLNRAKRTAGARITENTLIRVAVDLFLAQADRAVGDDEDAIRKSIAP